MSGLTENARKCLVKADWRDGRSIDTNAFEQANRESGLLVSEKALSFLREFGNLRLTFPHYRVPEHEDSCHFDAFFAAGNAIPDAIKEYENAVGRPLSVIGEARSDHMTLCMDKDGRVYGGFEDVLVKFGNSGIDAINCLVEGGDGERIEIAAPETPPARHEIELSDAARHALVEAGWVERDSDVIFEDELDAFLARFGGVSFKCPNRQTSFDVCRLDRIHVPEDYLRECSEQLREKLTPVGRLDESGVALLMDEQGRVFGGMVETADVLWLIGVSGADAINNLVAGNVARRVI